ncbi:hypothetical protein LXG23DRAFT_39147 [Yarrowia lipolytica]|nr:hypothetical protein LXG23DRAFT_39147 [Yarrowia lipolytica]RMI97109.1 hypothetical protein BD777DRAFT_153587 [Yarrowia lipolytica]
MHHPQIKFRELQDKWQNEWGLFQRCCDCSSYKLVKGDLAEIRKKPGCLTFTLEGRDANSDRGNVGDSYKSLEINAFQKPSKSSSAPTPFKKPPIIIGGDDGD